MYLAIDIGGSKTLLAVFSPEGERGQEAKIATLKEYSDFVAAVGKVIKNDFSAQKIIHACCAVPGSIDRQRGIGLELGNLAWRDVPIREDISQLLGGAPVELENDANLAGLGEAALLREKYNKVLYLTISTGIGDGIIVDGKISSDLADSEPGHMVLDHNGKLEKWEDFASGRALLARYGKKARDIDDPAIWSSFSKDIARGLQQLLAVIQPDVVVIGGGVGTYFEKFGDKLNAELKKLENNMVAIPPVIQAKRPEEAVIYGCYELIKQKVS